MRILDNSTLDIDKSSKRGVVLFDSNCIILRKNTAVKTLKMLLNP